MGSTHSINNHAMSSHSSYNAGIDTSVFKQQGRNPRMPPGGRVIEGRWATRASRDLQARGHTW